MGINTVDFRSGLVFLAPALVHESFRRAPKKSIPCESFHVWLSHIIYNAMRVKLGTF